MNSPFENIFPQTGFPPAFRMQYLLPVDAGQVVLFNGISDRVWHRPRWLWPFFWALSHFNILFPETGTNIPATMTLTGGRDAKGAPYQRWDRVFSFARPRYFNAVMAYDAQRQRVIEFFTPTNLLSMTWEISFHAPTRIEIITSTCQLHFGARQIRLPRLLHPHVHVIENALDDQTIQMSLTMSHPFLGEMFGYEGTYTVTIKDSPPSLF